MSWPGYCSSLASSRSNRVKASAVAPAKPPITSPLARRRTFLALALTMVWPIETCPSPPIATVPPLRTVRIVVPCQGSVSGWVIMRARVDRDLDIRAARCNQRLAIARSRSWHDVVTMATAPYGSWKSPITSTLIVERSIGLPDVRLDGDAIYWLEQRPRENRYVVVRGADRRDVVDAPFSVRTRVHEYGGGAWTVADDTLYFSNDQDRRLYRQRIDGQTPQAMTPEGPWRYADGIIDRARRRWIGVREDHTDAAVHNPENTIVAVDLSASGSTPGTVLAGGNDFFSSPRLSPDGRRLAWIAWDHPNMPWVGTTLYLAELDASGSPVGDPVAIAGGPEESIVQPEWSPDGATLVFNSDRSGWWNLHAHDVARRVTRQVVARDAEFAQAQWIFGMSSYAFVGRDRLVANRVENGVGRL